MAASGVATETRVEAAVGIELDRVTRVVFVLAAMVTALSAPCLGGVDEDVAGRQRVLKRAQARPRHRLACCSQLAPVLPEAQTLREA